MLWSTVFRQWTIFDNLFKLFWTNKHQDYSNALIHCLPIVSNFLFNYFFFGQINFNIVLLYWQHSNCHRKYGVPFCLSSIIYPWFFFECLSVRWMQCVSGSTLGSDGMSDKTTCQRRIKLSQSQYRFYIIPFDLFLKRQRTLHYAQIPISKSAKKFNCFT